MPSDRSELSTYRAKRNFTVTPEPCGRATQGSGAAFVVQKHAARRLHYDFRLELDGVLKSWAVTRGPSLDPSDRRLAVHVEDHPLDYGAFEGTIPQGEYGGGTVMLWDRGTWEPDGDAKAGYARARLKFALHGEKLKGHWTLVRMSGRAGDGGKNWLLIKSRDEEARPGDGNLLLDQADRSVTSGRAMDEIAMAADAKPPSKSSVGSPPRKRRRPRGPTQLPDFVAPQLPLLVEKAPDGPEWLHEIKFDGYRLLCRVADGKVKFLTRTGQDWTKKFQSLAKAVPATIKTAMIDGEAVVLDKDGATSFQALQEALSEGKDDRVLYYAFDLLHDGSEDLRPLPLELRKERLKALLGTKATGRFRYSDHIDGAGTTVFSKACHMALEGVVSKHRDSAYQSGRSDDWLKAKCTSRQEFVVGGYTEIKNKTDGIGALLIGYFEDEELRFAGKVGTGFTAKTRRMLRQRLEKLRRDRSSFVAVPNPVARHAKWTIPKLVAEITFSNWTRDGVLRHPSFQGLREDKPASAITKERPTRVQGDSMAAPRRFSAGAKGASIAGVSISHPDRVLFEEQGLTKRDLAQYCAEVADWILPHVLGRPLTMMRCPQGRGAKCFVQKHPGKFAPAGTRRVDVPGLSGEDEFLVIENAAGLVGLVQLGVLEFHVGGATMADLERPDRLVFDLDPDPGVKWPQVMAAARDLADRLKSDGLTSFVKTTGGKGLHVVVPIKPGPRWPEAKAFTKEIAETLAAAEPDRYTTNMRKVERIGRIFIDYLRNDPAATAIAPYSPRARANAPVAMPVDWAALTAKFTPTAFTVATVPALLRKRRRDPWATMKQTKQTLPHRGHNSR